MAPEPCDGRPLRVLLAADKLGYAEARLHGAGRLLVDWVCAFDPARVLARAVVLRDPGGIAAELARAGLPIDVLAARRFDPAPLLSLLRLVRRERIDLLHVQDFAAGALGRLAGLLSGRP